MSHQIDFTDFLSCKTLLQKIYTRKAKENREIIYATEIKEEVGVDESNEVKSNYNRQLTARSSVSSLKSSIFLQSPKILALITKSVDFYYIEKLIINCNYELTEINNKDLKSIKTIEYNNAESYKLTIISKNVSESKFTIEFQKEDNLNEFTWCLIQLNVIISGNTEIKGNIKSINENDKSNKYKNFNNVFKNVKTQSKNKIGVEYSELEFLNKELKINSIDDLNLDRLIKQIDQKSLERKELFSKQLQENLKADYENIFESNIEELHRKVNDLIDSSKENYESLKNLKSSIQKIEDKNHQLKIKKQNKENLKKFTNEIINNFNSTKILEKKLNASNFDKDSELNTIEENFDKFISFYKDMSIIKEREEIKNAVIDFTKKYNDRLKKYIKGNSFDESNLLKSLPEIKLLPEINSDKENKRKSLNEFLDKRKFVIRKLNEIGDKEDKIQEDFFSSCRKSLCEGISESFNSELKNILKYWNVFYESKIFNEEKPLDIKFDTFLTFDVFNDKEGKNDVIFEANKFFSYLILNIFFTVDYYMDLLINDFFCEEPYFLIKKDTDEYKECVRKITELFINLEKYIKDSCKKNIMFSFLFYVIFSAIYENLETNKLGLLSYNDIFDISYSETSNEPKIEVVKRTITVYETKIFIKNIIEKIKIQLESFLESQKKIIDSFSQNIRRIGIIPIVKKTINLFKFLFTLTKGIKHNYIYDKFTEFISNFENRIEEIANSNKKYTNIVNCENFHFIYNFFNKFNKSELDVENEKFNELGNLYKKNFILYKENYKKEIFRYQFEKFSDYFEKFQVEFDKEKQQITNQNEFKKPNFDKKVNTFLNQNFEKEMVRMVERIQKHFCIEEGLHPIIMEEQRQFLIKKINEIKDFKKKCYNDNEDFDVTNYVNIVDKIFKQDYSKLFIKKDNEE